MVPAMTSLTIPGRFELIRVGAGNRSTTDDRTFRRAVERGELVRVRRGVFIPASRWRGLPSSVTGSRWLRRSMGLPRRSSATAAQARCGACG